MGNYILAQIHIHIQSNAHTRIHMLRYLVVYINTRPGQCWGQEFTACAAVDCLAEFHYASRCLLLRADHAHGFELLSCTMRKRVCVMLSTACILLLCCCSRGNSSLLRYGISIPNAIHPQSLSWRSLPTQTERPMNPSRFHTKMYSPSCLS